MGMGNITLVLAEAGKLIVPDQPGHTAIVSQEMKKQRLKKKIISSNP